MTAPCALCGGSRFHKHALPHLRRCDGCGLVSVRRIPARAELEAVYGESYFRNQRHADVGYADYSADAALITRTAHRRLADLEHHALLKGRLLDVGCALGFFMAAARSRGWDVEGCDISGHAVSFARKELGLPARQGTLAEGGYASESFDAVTMWDVIEHVADPVTELRLAASLLAPGGVLAMTTPDAGSLPARLMRSRWMGYKLAEEHLYYFDRRTIVEALGAAGFEVVECRPVGKHISLGFFAERLSLYAGPAARMLGRALSAAKIADRSVYVNPGDILCVTARRPRAFMPAEVVSLPAARGK